MTQVTTDPTLIVADRAVRIWLQYRKDATVRDDLLMTETWRYLDMDHRGSDLDTLVDDAARWAAEWSSVNAMFDKHSWGSFPGTHKARLLNVAQQAHEVITSQGLNGVEAFFATASLRGRSWRGNIRIEQEPKYGEVSAAHELAGTRTG